MEFNRSTTKENGLGFTTNLVEFSRSVVKLIAGIVHLG